VTEQQIKDWLIEHNWAYKDANSRYKGSFKIVFNHYTEPSGREWDCFRGKFSFEPTFFSLYKLISNDISKNKYEWLRQFWYKDIVKYNLVEMDRKVETKLLEN